MSDELKYHKYENPDLSTAKYAPVVTHKILQIIELVIAKDVKRFYRARPDSILGIDLRHAVIRQLFRRLDDEIIKIDKFEKENTNDLRNYPWTLNKNGNGNGSEDLSTK